MPFVKRFVEPKNLSRKPLDNSVKDDLEAVTNATLVEALKQLACLVVFADEIFQDLTSQVKVIQSRTEKLKSTIGRIDQVVSTLNAKEVTVPVGTLDDFARIRHHYVSAHPVVKNLFLPSTRPEVVHHLYDEAVVTPVCIMREIDLLRQDGCRSSKYFLCLPFFKDVKVNFDVEIEMRRPASLNGAREWLSDDDTLDSIIIGTQFSETDGSNGGETSSLQLVTMDNDDILRQLPTPEEKTYVMSLKYPYRDVPIDVTGYGFRRMTTLRRSFIQQMENIAKRKKKGKRRNTVTGSVDNKETESALNDANKKSIQLSTAGTQTSDAEAGPEASRGQVRFDGGDSDSRDRLNSLKKKKKQQQNEKSSKEDCREDGHKDKESEKENSSGFRWFHRKARNRNSIIGGIGIYEELDRVKKCRKGLLASLIPAAISESGSSPSKSSTDSAAAATTATIRTGSGRKANAKNRISLPISTTSQTMAVAVKLRENSARTGGTSKEDGGQSSSGNWSASSSTRTSMESEEPVRAVVSPDLLNRTGSQTSLSKDSALSDRMTPNEDRGYPSDSTTSSTRKSYLRFAKRSSKTDTARWLRSLEEEGALGRSAGETTDAASSTGTLTPRIRRRTRSPFDGHPIFMDDGESSEFSVDTDGYYTSMHTDSGLRPLPIRSKNEVGSTLSKLSDLRERGSSSSLCSLSSSKNSSSSKKDTSNKDSSDQMTSNGTAKKVPPPPPPRTSTLSAACRQDSPTQSVSSVELDKDSTSNSVSSSVYRSEGIPSAVPSDSEAETGEKLKQKTAINTGRIPSLCVVTPNQSDDEDEQKGHPEPDVLRAAKEAIDAIAKVDDVEVCPSGPRSSWSLRANACLSSSGGSLADPRESKTQTLPRSSARSASFNAAVSSQQLTNTWPRRPNPLVYEPDLISVADKKPSAALGRTAPPKSATAVSMSTFAQPAREPNLFAGHHSGSQPCSPTGQEALVSPVSGSATGPSLRPGARVTLDSSGQVIHSTGSLPRRSSPASPTASTVSTPAQEQAQPPIRSASNPPPQRQGAYVRLDPNGGPISSRAAGQPWQIPVPKTSPAVDRLVGQPPRPAWPPQYHSNTLPRWRPLRQDRPASVAFGTGQFQPTYHADTVPRRWNNFGFLRRETPPLGPATSLPPEPFDTTKSGAYVRLDGHPTHLEPGTPSKSTAAGPQTSATPPVVAPNPEGPFGSRSSPGEVVPPQPPPYGVGHPPVAMPLMHQLSYRPSRIPLPSSAPVPRGSVNVLPTYYRPVEPSRVRPLSYAGSATTGPGPVGYPGNSHDQIGLPLASPPPYGVHSTVAKHSSPPFSRPAPLGDGRRSPSVTWTSCNSPHGRTTTPPSGTNSLQGPIRGTARTFSHPAVNRPTRELDHPAIPSSPLPNLPKPYPPPSPPSIAAVQRARTLAGDPDPYLEQQTLTAPMLALEQSSNSAMVAPPSPSAYATTSVMPSTAGWSSPATSDKRLTKPDRSEEVAKDSKLPKPTMSTDDLFSVIHQSKKKMNVKTDLDRSLSPASSRSSSPAFSVSSMKSTSSTKGRPPETGILSPRSRSPLCLPGDRRSWSSDRPFSSPTPTWGSSPSPMAAPAGDRRSLSSDRLGPIRPTSMHDFKLLLLHAGRGVHKEQSERRPSASELLKSPPHVPSAPISMDSSPVRSPRTPSNPVTPSGRITPPYDGFAAGQTSSPHRQSPRMNLFCNRLQGKHVQGRTRVSCAALHNRTDILSTPIMEDECDEEDAVDGMESGNCISAPFLMTHTPAASGFQRPVAAS